MRWRTCESCDYGGLLGVGCMARALLVAVQVCGIFTLDRAVGVVIFDMMTEKTCLEGLER